MTTALELRCSSASSLPVLPYTTNQSYNWGVNYTGQWNATVLGITGNGSLVLDQCYSGFGVGYVTIPDWQTNVGTALQVTAYKMDASVRSLTLAINGMTANTSTPYGSVMITAYLPATEPQSHTTSTVCVVPVEGTGTYLHIVSDSTQQPLPGITVNVLPTANSCFGFSIPGPAAYITNATGWVSLEGMPANYYFQTSLTYAGRSYNFSLPQGPLDTTNATLSLPSGNLIISLCYSLTTVNACRPYTETTTTASG
jgi:hypothetical protein